MVLPLLYLPSVVIYPISVLILSEVSAAWERGQRPSLRHQAGLSIAFSLLVGLMTALVLVAWPKEIAVLLYGRSDIAPLVTALALVTPFMYVQQISVSILNGLGLTAVATGTGAAGLSLRLALLWWLTSLPYVRALGPILAMAASGLLVASLNLTIIWYILRPGVGKPSWPDSAARRCGIQPQRPSA